jgi:hypothetical protein
MGSGYRRGGRSVNPDNSDPIYLIHPVPRVADRLRLEQEPMATSPACSKRSGGVMRSRCRVPPVQPTGLMGLMCLLGRAGAFLPLAEQLKIETDCIRHVNKLH